MQDTTLKRPIKWNLFLVLCTWLCVQTIRRFTTGATGFYETPSLMFSFDLVVVSTTLWLGFSLAESRTIGPDARAWLPFLLAVASLSGLAMLLLRWTTYDGWHSGHLHCCTGYGWF